MTLSFFIVLGIAFSPLIAELIIITAPIGYEDETGFHKENE